MRRGLTERQPALPGRWVAADMPAQAGRHFVITGANRGLGFEMARALAAKGADLTLGVRDMARGAAARAAILAVTPGARIDIGPIDMMDLATVRAFAARLVAGGRAIDVLVNNAAAILAPQGVSADGFETHMAVNYVAPLVLTLGLLPSMRAAGARIVNMSSTGHKLTKTFALDDLGFEKTAYAPMEAYCRSKLAALLFTQALNRRLQRAGSGAIAVTAHPGYAKTNVGLGGWGMRLATRLIAQPAAMGALPALYAATAPGVAAGDYIGPGGLGELRGYPARARPSRQAEDEGLAEGLWERMEKEAVLF